MGDTLPTVSAASTEAILHCVPQPVWVVDHEGLIVYINPAGVAALGYDELAELKGRPGHDTIHYKHHDGSAFPASECPLSQSRETGATVYMEEDWFVRRDGTMFPVSYTSTPIETPSGAGLVVAFSDIEDKLRAEQAARDRDVAEARAADLRLARRRIIEAGDAARAQLERDLHDGAQQEFVSALIHLQMAERRQESDHLAARELREHAIELAGAGLAELRRLAAGLHPAVLTDRGLGPAVEHLAARVPLVVSVLETPRVRLPGPVEASVFFFVSEALTNAVKHAHAGEATVRIVSGDGELTVEVADDGVGGAQLEGGTGLRGLGDRIAALDGTLVLDSPPGCGTRLLARIPLGR
jgi:PAS domain S-box-containing protein